MSTLAGVPGQPGFGDICVCLISSCFPEGVWESSRKQPAPCLESQLPDAVSRYPNPNSSLSPSAPEVSLPFQATESSPMHTRMPTRPFSLIIWGRMQAMAIIYWCRQESCLNPGAESCMPGRPLDAFICVKGKGGGKVEASLPSWARKE